MADFFGKIAGGISKGVAAVGANSKAMMERAKVNSAIGNLEAEQNQLFLLLGKLAFDRLKAGADVPGDESVINFVAQIEKRTELINEQKEQLKRIEAEVALITRGTGPAAAGGIACPCGHSNPPGTNFCAGCGAKVEAAAEACQCGHVKVSGAKFCAGCGSPQS